MARIKRQQKTKSKKTKSKKGAGKKLSTYLPRVKSGNGSDEQAGTSEARPIKKRRQYNPESMLLAYNAVKEGGISVHAASKKYDVPLTTLRDRVDGRIAMEAVRPGPPVLMEKDEESEIVHFLQTMARYGYRYTRHELAEIGTDQAVEKGKRQPFTNGLTTKWVDNFLNRWPCVKELSCRFKSKTDAEETVRSYFDEIKKIIDRFKLLDRGDRIFNIMEVNLSTDHRVQNSANTSRSHQFVTENTTNTTLIACGSVSGRALAPFFVFQANKIRPEMMTRVPSNVNASISETGQCSPMIFRRYLNEHFLPQARGLDNEPILVIMDGLKSHMFVGMSEWGRVNNVIFSFIPHHTTHLLQPLEVECAEAIRQKYEIVCRRHLKKAVASISRNSIGELACQAYAKVMTRYAISHSFKKAGVFPDVESDDSGDDADSKSSDDSLGDSTDHSVLSGGDTSGHHEVTEEEVVTTHEVALDADGQPEEMLVTQDGQLVLAKGGDMLMNADNHLVIHGGAIFVNNGEHGFSQLQLIASDDSGSIADIKPDTSRLSLAPNDINIPAGGDHDLSSQSAASSSGGSVNLSVTVSQAGIGSVTSSAFDLASSSEGVGLPVKVECDSDNGDDEVQSGARTLPLEELLRRNVRKDNHRQSVLIQKVIDFVQPK